MDKKDSFLPGRLYRFPSYVLSLFFAGAVLTAAAGAKPNPDVKRYYADPALIRLIRESSTTSGETDTAKWMTGTQKSLNQ